MVQARLSALQIGVCAGASVQFSWLYGVLRRQPARLFVLPYVIYFDSFSHPPVEQLFVLAPVLMPVGSAYALCRRCFLEVDRAGRPSLVFFLLLGMSLKQ